MMKGLANKANNSTKEPAASCITQVGNSQIMVINLLSKLPGMKKKKTVTNTNVIAIKWL